MYFDPLQGVLDIFCVAHTLGWFGKALILRDYWFCWVCPDFPFMDLPPLTTRTQILSIAFEFAEYSLQHQLSNFEEVLSPSLLHLHAVTYICAVLVGPREFNTPATSPNVSQALHLVDTRRLDLQLVGNLPR